MEYLKACRKRMIKLSSGESLIVDSMDEKII